MVEKKGILITFSINTQKVNPTQRTVFFRKLYGWKQVVPNEETEKKYEYERPGILDEVPHEKVNPSSFIVPEDQADKIFEFFNEWSNKVMWRTFEVLLDNHMQKIFRDMEKFFSENEEEV